MMQYWSLLLSIRLMAPPLVNRHVYYKYTGLGVAKNNVIIFGNNFLDIRENSEWPHLLWPTLLFIKWS